MNTIPVMKLKRRAGQRILIAGKVYIWWEDMPVPDNSTKLLCVEEHNKISKFAQTQEDALGIFDNVRIWWDHHGGDGGAQKHLCIEAPKTVSILRMQGKCLRCEEYKHKLEDCCDECKLCCNCTVYPASGAQ